MRRILPRSTAAQIASVVLKHGEVVVDESGTLYVGDGVTPGGIAYQRSLCDADEKALTAGDLVPVVRKNGDCGKCEVALVPASSLAGDPAPVIVEFTGPDGSGLVTGTVGVGGESGSGSFTIPTGGGSDTTVLDIGTPGAGQIFYADGSGSGAWADPPSGGGGATDTAGPYFSFSVSADGVPFADVGPAPAGATHAVVWRRVPNPDGGGSASVAEIYPVSGGVIAVTTTNPQQDGAPWGASGVGVWLNYTPANYT